MIDRHRALSLAALALVLALAYGIWYAYSVFMVTLLREFGWSRSVLAGAFSTFTLVHGACIPIVGWLCDRVRPERMVMGGGFAVGLALTGVSFIDTPTELYLYFGVFTAVSVATCGWVPAVIQVQRRFQDRMGFALGIVSSGVGLGMLLVVPLCQALMDAFGWRIALRILGLICVACIVPCALYLMRSAPTGSMAAKSAAERPAASAGGSAAVSLTLAQAMRTAPFWLIMATFFFGGLGSQTMHVHQVAYLVDHGLSAMIGASVVGVVGGASMVAKISGGWLSDRIDREIVFIAGISVLVASVAALALVGRSPTVWGAYGYAVLLGVGYSVTASLTPVLTSDRFTGPHFGSIVGAGLLASALGAAVGPWFAGWQFDLTGSYRLAFIVVVVCCAIAGTSAWFARSLRKRALQLSAAAANLRPSTIGTE